jgi:serine/threonine protein kinase
MKLKVLGENKEIAISDNDFVSKGGEGSIYAKPPLAFKVCEPGKMIPIKKIKELASLQSAGNILCPLDVLVDSKNNPVGYTMDYVQKSFVLCQLFPKAFRTRHNLSNDMIWQLVKQMQDTTQFIHKQNILVVDYNELNFLVSDDFRTVHFIDVNSYQTPSYPATAIMESVRDRHCKGRFSTNTDWFSFAILSFQMLIGIHPYKGKHPKFNDASTSLEQRMLANISVLNSDVKFPKGACQPFDIIPTKYAKWYKDVFDKGERIPPPNDDSLVQVPIATHIISGSDNFIIKELGTYKANILSLFADSNHLVVSAGKYTYTNSAKIESISKFDYFFLTSTGQLVSAGIVGGKLKLTKCGRPKKDSPLIECEISADQLFTVEGRLYVQSGGSILEIDLVEIGTKKIASSKQVSSVLPKSTKIFQSVIVENLFGSYYFSIFSETGLCHQIRIKELEEHRIVDAKYENGLLAVVVVNKNSGKYNRYLFWFTDSSFSQYKYVEEKDINYTGLNFTVLSNKTCVLINEDEHLEIFKVNNPIVKKIIKDPIVPSDMKLYNNGSEVLFSQGNKIYSLKMKK